ncbi:MAG: hypothetical protein SPI83_02200 [Rothia sp. (in: high G+C Gram-positive bacteria)]|nr:hypothetical protein [Rothia sp. (in: high G+C Gram-positive bacteria)]
MISLNRRSALKATVAGSLSSLALTALPSQASAAETSSEPAINRVLAAMIDQAFASSNTVRNGEITVDFFSPLSALDGFAQDAYVNVRNNDQAPTEHLLQFRIDLPKTSVTENSATRWMTRALSSYGKVAEIHSGVAGQKSYIWTIDRFLGGSVSSFKNSADMVFGFGDGLSRSGRIKNAIVVTPLTDGAPDLRSIVGDNYVNDSKVIAYYEAARATWRAAGYGYKYGFKAFSSRVPVTPIAWGESVDSRIALNAAPSGLNYDHNGIY